MIIIHPKYIRNNLYRNVNVFCPISAKQNERIMRRDSDAGNQNSTCERQDDWYSRSRLIWFTSALSVEVWGRVDSFSAALQRPTADVFLWEICRFHNWFGLILSQFPHVLKWKTDDDFDFREQSCLLCSFSPRLSGVSLLIDYSLWFHVCPVICCSPPWLHPPLPPPPGSDVWNRPVLVFCCVSPAHLFRNIESVVWFRMNHCD